MFEGFARSEIKTSGARIVAVHGGNGPPLLLMHGNPFSHLSWQKIAPRLAREFTVVATDLRGYGNSEKPPGGKDHSGYSFRAMAQDQIEVMAALGHERFYAAGHDRGARVLQRMCLDHADKVVRAAILDIIPQRHLLNNVSRQWATFSWHWFFMIQPYDFPERLMAADPDYFIERKLSKTKQGLSFFDPAALAEYKRYFRNPATIHAMCEDLGQPMALIWQWTEEDFAAGHKIACPLLLLWGATGGVGRNHNSMQIWPLYASNIVAGKALPCGHYLSDEAPEETYRELRFPAVSCGRMIDALAALNGDAGRRRCTVMRMALAVLALALLAGSAARAQGTPAEINDSRYTNKLEEGYLRLDGRTGQVSLCTRREAGWACQAAPDERSALEAEIARLHGESAALKGSLARNLPLPGMVKSEPPVRNPEQPSLQVPSDADLNKMMTFIEKVWRRFGNGGLIVQKVMLNRS